MVNFTFLISMVVLTYCCLVIESFQRIGRPFALASGPGVSVVLPASVRMSPLHSSPVLQYRGTHMEDEEEEEEEEAPAAPASQFAPEISVTKEGIKFASAINGSDVRVGIIMARWNADIIGGLYSGVNESLQVRTCTQQKTPSIPNHTKNRLQE